MKAEHVDVLIVGAGLSGIGGAYFVQTKCPTKSYAILEGRDTIEGSRAPWRLHQNYALDLFGVRYSDVDDGTMEFRS
jgi:cation diffusion facilitator CzcD-associated flavoprotein CzcO